ncbi:hypothetical protein H0I25_16970 [Cellulophaga sp. HaHa_2_95]|uniref:DUF2231 domain-containing protein n=1 Tax=Cellulophaga sp. HaHa_2_95 TaxID=2745558 RepID=UPI001C4EAB5D|nr:DUF2231 domain-containing protein [Cellulophaga sp. HaHa_2_95]QXP55734.1 hypothetical protein H0I25_16970 [Cellulophaga sp. HaHa_2_95]
MENSVPDIVLFLGRFHPLVVHLPIGFLFFAFVLEVSSRWKKNPVLTSGIPLALFLGAVSGTVACILGYMLSLSGDYEESALDTHFWFGIVTTVIAFLAWLIRIEKINIASFNKLQPNISALTLLVVLLSVTGHYGGNLTHGSDYLVKYLPFGGVDKKELVAVTKVQDAEVFGHLVAPILQNKCASCHNSSKKKGGLSIADSVSILVGGKNGEILIPGDANNSEILKRVVLDPHDDNFMPPEGKTPLTEEEIAILTYWIENAKAGFSTKVAAVETNETITGIASTMLGLSGTSTSQGAEIEIPQVALVPDDAIIALQAEGFRLRELAFESGLYEAVLAPNSNVNGTPKSMSEKLEKLLSIKENILWLSLEDNQIADEHIALIAQFPNIQKLKLNDNPLSDAAVTPLIKLENLTSVNLLGTKITSKSIPAFSEMKRLKYAYVWKTNIQKEDVGKQSIEDFPKIIIE